VQAGLASAPYPLTLMGMKTRAIAIALLSALALTSCSQAELQQAVQDGEQFVAQRAAVTAAESLRVTLISKAKAAGVSPEAAEFILKTAATLPGLQVQILDADNNGMDDDGRITVTSLGAMACLTLPNLSQEGSAVAGAC
jgi:hypothetical protein